MNFPDQNLSDGRLQDDRSPVEQFPVDRLPVEHSPVEHSPVERPPAEPSVVEPFPVVHSPVVHHSGRRMPVRVEGVTARGDATASLQSLLGTVVIAVFVITFVVQAFQIPSPSMENTLLVGDYLLVNKLCYGGGSVGDSVMPYHQVRRGDIVVFHYPVDPAQHFVKRVIGVPGDRVRLINKQVFVNGVSLKEPYAHFSRPADDMFRDSFPRLDIAPGVTPEWWVQLRKLVEDGQLIVPQGHYFVMGDNRDDSYDSRYWGFVPEANIIGRPLLIYWSVRGSEGETASKSSVSGKLYNFAYALTHIVQITRWKRTLQVVN